MSNYGGRCGGNSFIVFLILILLLSGFGCGYGGCFDK